MGKDLRINLDGFVRRFREVDLNEQDKQFCFILGAGASKPSGIRLGGELARYFLGEIHVERCFTAQPLVEWATAENLGIPGFVYDKAEEFYPQLYQQYFAERADSGYAFLEKEMENREPSYGYSVLAWILANTRHRVVVTPNFDNLVADALSIHTTTFPRTVGHVSLAHYVQASLRRPLIVKVHGDLGFMLRNTPDEIASLSDGWKPALERVFARFTPIVIGYGGNDGSLMALLETLPAGVPNTIYWCQLGSGETPARIAELLRSKHGRVVPIPGFDQLMLKLQDTMREVWKIKDLYAVMCARQRAREAAYKEQSDKLGSALAKQPEPQRADSGQSGASSQEEKVERRELAAAATRNLAPTEGAKSWWQWQLEADAAANVEEKDSVYQAGIEALPQSAELLGNYALFLHNERKDMDLADEFYRRAIHADPKDADFLVNYANFLRLHRKDMERAGEFYRRAIDAAPKDAPNLGNYANFLRLHRKDMERAEEFYRRAIEADPKEATNLANYAGLLLALGRTPEGLERLAQAEALPNLPPDLSLELAFYRLAHDRAAWPAQLKAMQAKLARGDRSPGWSLETNIEQAAANGHPNPELLRALAKVINDEAPLESLDSFPEWRNAK